MAPISVGTQRDIKSVMVVVGFLAVVASVALGWGDLKHTGDDALKRASNAEERADAVQQDVHKLRVEQATQGADLKNMVREQQAQRALLEAVAQKVGAK